MTPYTGEMLKHAENNFNYYHQSCRRRFWGAFVLEMGHFQMFCYAVQFSLPILIQMFVPMMKLGSFDMS